MSDSDKDTESLRQRLADLQGAETKGDSAPKKKPRAWAALLMGGAFVLAGLVYVYSQPQSETELPTRKPSEFQTEGSSFGDLTKPERPEPTPAPQAVVEPEQAPANPNSDLIEQIRALKAEIESLKDRPAEPEAPVVQDDGLADLRAQMEKIRQEAADRERELQDQLKNRDMEIAQLNTEMDMLRLQGGQPLFGGDESDLMAQRAQAADEAAQREQERLSSSMIAIGGGGDNSGNGAFSGDQAAAQQAAKLSDDAQFVRSAGRPVEVQRAEIIVNPSNTVTQGTMIQAVLETAIDSTLEGPIRGQVTTDVVSYDGSRVLIPRGSKLIGAYSADVDSGQSRLLVAWERIIMPDAQSVQISSFGGDALGRSGVTGKVNSHFLKRFGAAALVSTISALPSILEDRNSDGSSVTISTGGSQGVSAVSGALGSATDAAIGKYINMPPTITVPQGTRITVMVDRDLEIF